MKIMKDAVSKGTFRNTQSAIIVKESIFFVERSYGVFVMTAKLSILMVCTNTSCFSGNVSGFYIGFN